MNGRYGTPGALALLQGEIDDSAAIDALSLKSVLSIALTSRYVFHDLSLLNQRYVLATPRDSFTVDRLAADLAVVEAKTGKQAIALFPSLSPYFRKTLIARRIPFILEDKQAFLPFIYLNLTKSKPAPPTVPFAPATQLVFLALLYAEGEARSHGDLASRLGLSPMSVSRAVAQLAAHQLIEVTTTGKTGRRKLVRVLDPPAYYRTGMSHFGNPLKQSLHLAGPVPEGLPRSGVDALSRRTLVSAPARPSYAAGYRRRAEWTHAQIDKREALDRQDSFTIDLLAYDPLVLAVDGLVDPVTMTLTLAERDERIDQALDDYLKGFPWYSG